MINLLKILKDAQGALEMEGAYCPEVDSDLNEAIAALEGPEGKYSWVVRFDVDPTWVADGFELSKDEQAKSMLETRLPFAYGSELGAKVLNRPDPEAVAKEQGYADAADKAVRDRK